MAHSSPLLACGEQHFWQKRFTISTFETTHSLWKSSATFIGIRSGQNCACAPRTGWSSFRHYATGCEELCRSSRTGLHESAKGRQETLSGCGTDRVNFAAHSTFRSGKTGLERARGDKWTAPLKPKAGLNGPPAWGGGGKAGSIVHGGGRSTSRSFDFHS